MVVCDDGQYAGSVSSGCVDATVAAMAITAIENGESKRVKLGAGSPFVDIKLPCGGGVDLLILPEPACEVIDEAVQHLQARQSCALSISPAGVKFIGGDIPAEHGADGTSFTRRYSPRLKLLLAGRGAELTRFCKIARAGGFDVAAFGPDLRDLEICEEAGAATTHLASSSSPVLSADQWTAIVLLFHDHDWEESILREALKTDAFYIGALGSRKTQATRLEVLRQAGVSEDERSRIRGPIGLVPSMRNASMLAISALAEIIEAAAKSANA